MNVVVSIITPVFNGSSYLSFLLDSVQSQTFENIEHIVIDDGSNDGGKTVSILEKYSNTVWWSRENRGLFATVNEGIRRAKGDIITIIHSDDYYANVNAVLRAVEQLDQHKDWEFVYGNTEVVDKDGKLQTKLCSGSMGRLPKWLMYYQIYAPHCSLFVRKKFLIDHNLFFDETYRCSADVDWLIRLAAHAKKWGCVEETIAAYRLHGQNLSLIGRTKAEIKRDQISLFKKHGMRLGFKPYTLFLYRWMHRFVALRDGYRAAGMHGAADRFRIWLRKKYY